MKISDEMLLAYVDNELDDATRAEVDAAIASDPALAKRVEQQRSLRKLLGAAYDPVLDEPVPPRLVAAAKSPRARVVELASARNSARQQRRADAPPRPAWGWPVWGGMAACLVAGVVTGRLLPLPGDDVTTSAGQVVAQGDLARALSTQLASAQPAGAPVHLATSYLSRAGEYCRSFTLVKSGAAGVACRHGNDWTLRVLAQDRPPPAGGDLRMAASPLPPSVLRVIDEQIQAPLDAKAEQAALQSGWRAPGR
jgi:hypothetical protein